MTSKNEVDDEWDAKALYAIGENMTKRGRIKFEEARANGGYTKALVDTRASYNFLTEDEARKLGIKYTKNPGWFNVINSLKNIIISVVFGVHLKIPEWEDTIDLTVSRVQQQLHEMCKHVMDRSQGQLVDITIMEFGDNELLRYAADRSSQLRSFGISFCYNDAYESWTRALRKFALLEELSIYITNIPKEAIETDGCYYPLLKTMKLNDTPLRYGEHPMTRNEIAITIRVNLLELRDLELLETISQILGWT
ncbi:unnamed protein product [Lactuca saligna]|uniref:Uncharacterized protein n=1 Tax=Lactuca saligna TaxID=75948 RepID=A0AA35Y7A6_LACSI|nr:unnamed protein product [Lactuca saligna]